jgi:pantetheine-phosphate adenylyltransferase
MGGRIALTIAGSVDNPYRAVALLAPSGNPGGELMVPFLGGQAEYDRLYAEASGDKGYAEFLTQWGQTQQLSKTWFDELLVSKPLDAIGNFKGDMLIVYGDKDVVVPAEVNKAVAAAYPAAKVVVVPEADRERIQVVPFEGLLIHFARDVNASLIIRGLRAVSDFEYEIQMANMNARMEPAIETIFLMASDRHQFIASSLVKDIARLGGDTSQFVSKRVFERLKAKFAKK